MRPSFSCALRLVARAVSIPWPTLSLPMGFILVMEIGQSVCAAAPAIRNKLTINQSFISGASYLVASEYVGWLAQNAVTRVTRLRDSTGLVPKVGPTAAVLPVFILTSLRRRAIPVGADRGIFRGTERVLAMQRKPMLIANC